MTREHTLRFMTDREAVISDIRSSVGPHVLQELPRIGDASLFNLATAIVAIETPGIAGELVVSIPRKVTDRLELHWHSVTPSA